MEKPAGLDEGGGVEAGVGWGRGIFFSVLVIAAVVLHNDLWNWMSAKPLLFGFLPIGLWYHAAYSVGCAVLMWLLVMFAWPRHLETLEQHSSVGQSGVADSKRDEGGH